MRPLTPRRILGICGILLFGVLFVARGDFTAHGRLSDFGARHRDDAFQRRD